MLTRRAWFSASTSVLFPARAAVPARPNVLLIVADDLGYSDLSSYGCPDIRTPEIDSIGSQGVRFTHFYANGPECSPTRTALLTGRYQQRVGGLECAIGVGDQGRYDEAAWLQKRGELGLPPEELTMGQVFKRAGYDTACFGKWHLGYPEKFWPHHHGFDESFGILGGNADYFTHKEEDGRPVLYHNGKIVERAGYTTDLIAEAAIEWLKGRKGKPFFLYLPFTCPHTPIQDPDGFDPAKGTAPWQNGNRKVYAKMVERMDRRVGDVLRQLDRMGAAANTIVIFISDNGGDPNGRNLPLRGRKSTTWEGGIRVPCLVRWPVGLPKGITVKQVGITMDWLPTLLAATGAATPPGRKFDGVNLLEVMRGKQPVFARTLFWRGRRGNVVRKAVRDGDWKLVDDNGLKELHNLSVDETEQRDLLVSEPRRATELEAKLKAWEREVQSPRLRGFRAG